MKNFMFNREVAQLAVLQRIELATPLLKKIRKLFGRYLFSNLFSKYFINPHLISINYFDIMNSEFEIIRKFLKQNQKILSIGAGIGGLEIIINRHFINSKFSFIERNFLSKKIKYGWDYKNEEAYNNLEVLKNFLINNKIQKQNFEIFDYDKDIFPIKKFDTIISLYSLDFHYNFEIYQKYLKKVSDQNTVIIFDTVRPDYFYKIFDSVEILKDDSFTIHKSKRLACRSIKI